MTKNEPNVQKLDVQPLDIFHKALAHGLYRLKTIRRSIKFDFWRGSLAAEETVTTVEPTDARQ
jgi:hypothetical protein